MNRGVFYIILANLVAGTSYIATKEAMKEIPPSFVLIFRVIVCFLVMLPFVYKELKKSLSFNRVEWIQIGIMSLIGASAALVAGIYGLRASTAANAALLIGVEPVAIVVLSAIFLKERIGIYRGVGIALALSGATLIVNNGIPLISRSYTPHIVGDLILVFSGICFATYSVAGREILQKHSSLLITFITNVFSVIGFIPLAFLETSPLFSSRDVSISLVWVVYLGIIVSFLSYLWWNKSLQYLEASQIAVFINLQPLVGALLGWMVLGDSVNIYTLVGGLFIGVGVYLSMRKAV